MPFQSINARPLTQTPKSASPGQTTSESSTTGPQANDDASASQSAKEPESASTKSSNLNDENKDSSDSEDESTDRSQIPVTTPTSEERKGFPSSSSSAKKPNSSNKPSDSKRSHNRAYQTLHTGSKIKHLKKRDGEPLWRVDIQYDFLAYIFHNELKVFTNCYKETSGHTFADIYIDAMARSSKTSKVLCEKLLGDRKAGLNMAMVCLLVNIGRMNTTLNFFPEMRAQLRTYHPIPSLQTYSDQSDYKQLQDAPRLKSILKGACDDRPEPATLEELEDSKRIPKTNPINLCFLLSTFANKIQHRFFVAPYEFHDLIMNKSISSESRGKAFLWLMWAFLETDLSPEALERNPFGPGLLGGHCIPELKLLTTQQMELENIDTSEEFAFGATMTKERKIYIDAAAQLPNSAPTAGGSGGGSGNSVKLKMKEISSHRKALEATGSPEPHGSTHGIASRRSSVGSNESDLDDDDLSDIIEKSRSPSPARLRLILKAPNRAGVPRGKQDSNAIKTQVALREAKCQLEIQRLLRNKDQRSRNLRYRLGPILREWNRIKDMDPLYDSDKDDYPRENGEEPPAASSNQGTTVSTKNKRKKIATAIPDSDPSTTSTGTINGNGTLTQEAPLTVNTATILPGSVNRRIELPGDYGEESTAMASTFRRSSRWLERWNKENITTKLEDVSEAEKLERRNRQLERETNEIRLIGIMLEEEKEKALVIEKELEQMREKEIMEKNQAEVEKVPIIGGAGGKSANKSKASKASSKKRKPKEGEDMMSVMGVDGTEETNDKKKATPRRSRKRKDSNEGNGGSVEKKLKTVDATIPISTQDSSISKENTTSSLSNGEPSSETIQPPPDTSVPLVTADDSPNQGQKEGANEKQEIQNPPQEQAQPAANGTQPSVMSLGNLLD